MAVLAGFRALGIFDRMANLLLARAKKMRQLALTLVMLCFFSAMLVTNDVALITFVPFTILLLQRVHLEEKLIPVIVLQTIAANLGSMLSPCWQSAESLSLYHFGDWGRGVFQNYPAVCSRVLLSAASALPFAGKHLLSHTAADNATHTDRSRKTPAFRLDGAVFSLPAGSFPHPARSAAVGVGTGVVSAVSKRDSERGGLLPAAHVCIFLYLIGNLGRISAIREVLQTLLYGREVLVSFLSCQLISNVPAAVLLSEFTDRYDLLLAGVNIGGLGTLIASMASLISYKYFAQIPNVGKGKYLLRFTLANLLFAIVLLGLAALLPS